MITKKMKPAEEWNEGGIAEFNDGSIRVTRDAMMSPDFARRVGMYLKAHGPSQVELSFTRSGRPVWMGEGATLLAELIECNGQTLRCHLPRRNHPVDYYWEELEWVGFDSPLPSVD